MSSQNTPSPPHSTTTTSPSPVHPSSDDEKHALSPHPSPPKLELPSDPTPPSTRTPVFPSREECWSEEATRTLIDAWGSHYLQLNRGNLRQKHWQEVANAVNALHATSAKLRRTDVQCKNRIDTTKKKYKIEKSMVVQSNGRYISTWPHFKSLDSLIGLSFSKNNNNNANGQSRNLRRRASTSPELSPSPPPLRRSTTHHRKNSPERNHKEKDPVTNHLPRLAWSVPVGPRSKRSGPRSVTERNFSVMAAAAAAMEAEYDEEDDDEHSEAWGRRLPAVGTKRKKPMEEEGTVAQEGYRCLAEAIVTLGKIYEKVEAAKRQQMLKLEKQRMQFARDLELQRMNIFMESHVQLEKLKPARRNSEHTDRYL